MRMAIKPYIDDVCHGTPDSEDNPDFDVPPTEAVPWGLAGREAFDP